MSQEVVRPSGLGRQYKKWKGTSYSTLDVQSQENLNSREEGRSWHSIGERDVEIVLDSQMTIAWREPGEIWKAVSSRIVTARTKIAKEDGAIC